MEIESGKEIWDENRIFDLVLTVYKFFLLVLYYTPKTYNFS